MVYKSIKESGVENWILSYKNHEHFINAIEVCDSVSLNLPLGLIIPFILDFISINNFLF